MNLQFAASKMSKIMSNKHSTCSNPHSSPSSLNNQIQHNEAAKVSETSINAAASSPSSSTGITKNTNLSPIKVTAADVKTCDVAADIKLEEPGLKDEIQESLCEKNVNNKSLGNNGELIKIKKEDNSPQLSPKEYSNDSKTQVSSTKNFNEMQKVKTEERSFNVSQEGVESCGSPINNLKNQQIYPNTCMDYIQHQNHIFVFSTQLANKAAESVLNSQFPTIIAYHCMQPSTKNFLDEFFAKNPMKMSKFQRQTNQNSHGSLWNNSCNTNLQTKCNNKPNQNTHSAGDKGNQHPTQIGESTNLLQNNDDFISWDSSSERESLKLFDEPTGTIGPQNVLNKSISSLDANNDINIPSLQGVKVPDENLTPQQRQHREEQLAKLKKMNQFLFPENMNDEKAEVQTEATSIGTNAATKRSSKNIDAVLLGMSPCDNTNVTSHPINNMLPFQGTVSNQCRVLDCNSKVSKSCDSIRTELIQTNVTNNPSTCGSNINNKRGQSESTTTLGINNVGTCNSQFQDESSNPLLNTDSNDFNQKSNSGSTNRILATNSMQEVGINNIQDWQKLQNKQSLDTNSLSRSIQSIGGVSNRSNNTNCLSNQNLRNLHGPPPPYHSTQRSASVPISTHSPNPSSPNTNQTSALSLPSPRTSSNVSHISSSPNLDPLISMASNSTSTTTTTSSSSLVHSKISYGGDDTGNNNTNINRLRVGLNHLTSNTNTINQSSMKDIDTYNATGSSEETKTLRFGSTQRSKTPVSSDNTYPSNSPGLNFAQQFTNSSFKGVQVNVDRQTCISNPPLYSKRSENIPLNPNNSRIPQTKPQSCFDPISSLAQMSQQLTSCSTLNSSLGNGSSGLNISHHNDLNLEAVGNQNIDTSLKALDGCLDICNLNANNSMNAMSHLNNNAHAMASNCQPVLGNMGQRMVNPKSTSNFSPHSNMSRDGSGNFSTILGPSPRMFPNRMGFGYNIPPNVQIRASTPNTIQYMPVRPQNTNCGVRMAPSLEFLQRYTNPTLSGNMNPLEISHVSQVAANEQNKLNDNGNQGNFFQNCGELGMVGSEHEQGSMNFPDIDLNLNSSIVRGVRPIRPNVPNIKTQTISPNILESGEPISEVGPLMCNNVYNSVNQQQQHMFQNSQQKNIKAIAGCNNIQSPNEHSSLMHSQINSGCIGAENSYKYMSSSQNDVKYAQQYHSFQQQLYATSTRVQQGSNSTNISSSNQFFANK